MKKLIIQSFAIIAVVIVLQACNQNGSEQKVISNEPIKEIPHPDYQCPMDCEKGKVYHEEGKCPVCGMDLKKVEHNANEIHWHDSIVSDSIHFHNN